MNCTATLDEPSAPVGSRVLRVIDGRRSVWPRPAGNWAMALGWYVFDEAVVWTTMAGAALIIAGCLIAARANPKLAEPIEATI